MTVEGLLARGAGFQGKARVFSTPAIEWPEAALPVHPYIVGCLLGNACLRQYPYPHSIGLTMRRSLPLYRMRRFGTQFGRVAYYGGAYYTHLVKAFARLVKGQPYYGTGSRTKFVPAPYTLGSLEQRPGRAPGLPCGTGRAPRHGLLTEREGDSCPEQP